MYWLPEFVFISCIFYYGLRVCCCVFVVGSCVRVKYVNTHIHLFISREKILMKNSTSCVAINTAILRQSLELCRDRDSPSPQFYLIAFLGWQACSALPQFPVRPRLDKNYLCPPRAHVILFIAAWFFVASWRVEHFCRFLCVCKFRWHYGLLLLLHCAK